MFATKKSLLILSHTLSTFQYLDGGIGEIANASKLKILMNQRGHPVSDVIDIYSLFGGVKGIYHTLASCNISLAYSGEEILEETSLLDAKSILNQIISYQPQAVFLLSLNWSVAALTSLGLHKKVPLITKLYVHHEDDKIPTSLYQPSTLLLTESLLASKKAMAAGIPPWKIVFFPNHFPKECKEVKKNRRYLLNIAEKNNKTITLSKNTTILGVVSRLEYGKNIEYALDVASRLAEEGEDILFILKGKLCRDTLNSDYVKELLKKIELLSKKSWFLWDSDYTPMPEVFEQYCCIDILLHLSGAEAGSNIITEFLGLGKPIFLLNATVNPSLYQGGAIFVTTNGFVKDAPLPFALPDSDDLYRKLKEMVKSKAMQAEWGKKSGAIAEQRFLPEMSMNRLPLILKAAEAYFSKNGQEKAMQKKIENLYEKDRSTYWPE